MGQGCPLPAGFSLYPGAAAAAEVVVSLGCTQVRAQGSMMLQTPMLYVSRVDSEDTFSLQHL